MTYYYKVQICSRNHMKKKPNLKLMMINDDLLRNSETLRLLHLNTMFNQATEIRLNIS